ncbi:regulatory protein RecX [Austwickia chelonae]|uniref:regulatory protein RecX n=1 Tax=Austwickia chelonae TaxID=100225 RepID=UPI001966F8AD|nr:regulatory protein RecX [Austwickia chelonae]
MFSSGGRSPEENARSIVLRQLNSAPRTRAQLEQALSRRGCDEDVARRVLDRFQEVGLIDDEAYAGMLVRSQRSNRSLARRALRVELRKKGVPDAFVESALAEVSDSDEQDEARKVVEKRLRTMRGLPRETQARRLAGVLARKGYPGEIAYSVIRRALEDLPEHRRD